MGFWLQLGVAGFRVDAVPFVLEKPPRGSRPEPDPFRVPEGVPRLPPVARRRRRAARRGERAAGSGGERYFADGDGPPHDVQLLGQPASVPLACSRGRTAACRGAAGDPEPAADGTVGALSPQPRRARPRPPRCRRPKARLRRVRPGAGDAALRARDPPPAGADARRRAPARARVQPRPLAAGHSGAALRRRDRHGRRPAPEGARRDPDADAVVRRAERRLLDERHARASGRSPAGRTATRTSTSSSSCAIRSRCSGGRPG